jgi:eukaryotic-like serine/threonine-protein kinase
MFATLRDATDRMRGMLWAATSSRPQVRAARTSTQRPMTEEQQEQPGFTRQARSRLGTTLNAKYRLDRLLGVGGMASVYAATHRNGNRVAVKLLHGPLSLDADIRRRFLREGYVANKVSHPGAVQVIDDCEAEDGTAFLVMELLDGESLDVRWTRFARRMPAREVLAITHELLDILGNAHVHGIVHRDIKPANIFLTVEGEVKVLDFGIARLLEVTHGHAHTHTGRAVGTPAFMPPEQALGKTREIDGQTDLWAVGATMFTLLSGDDVHQAENVSEQLVFAATKPSRSLAVVAPEIAPEIVLVVDRAISFAKSARWADARAMRDAVAEAHEAAFGEPIASSVEQLRGGDELGPVRSASPRAFAPTVRSTPPAAMESSTEPSTELRVSQLGAGHPTTGGGAFSLEGRSAHLTNGTLASMMGLRRRSLGGLGIVAAAATIIVSASVFGHRLSSSSLHDPVVLASGSPGNDGLATAMPVGFESPAFAEPKLGPSAAPSTRVSTPEPTAPPASSAAASTVKGQKPPHSPAPSPSTTTTAAQGGVVVTVPY